MYTIWPGTLARGSSGTTTTFDGVGVRTGPPGPPGPPLPPTVGSEPPSSAKVTAAMMTRPTTEAAGATSNGSRRTPAGTGPRGRGLARVIGSSRGCEPQGSTGPDRNGHRFEDQACFLVVAGR